MKKNKRKQRYRCDLCNLIMLPRKKTKHNKTKTHKYFSNLILIRYVIKDVEVAKFKDVFDPYFTHHSRKFNFFTVCIICRHHSNLLGFYDCDHLLDHKKSIANNITFRIESENYSACTTESACDFLHIVISIFSSSIIIHKIEIVFISDLKTLLDSII